MTILSLSLSLSFLCLSSTGADSSDSKELHLTSREETTDVNFDLVHAFDVDFNHAVLPARPDLLLLPSDLKPFAKVNWFEITCW